MPILTIQRRQHEVGRIRLGQKGATGAPQKLDRFRLTSPDRTLIEAAAALYGGQAQPWDGAPIGEQWEVVTDAREIPVIVPPGPSVLSQFYETWSGGGCTRRCDGETEFISGDPCACAAEDEQTCKPTTRLSVMLAELPGIGVWRLESHGFNAATELAGTVDVLQAAAGRGQLLPAVLRLDERQVKRPGETTRNFVVPVLEIRVTPSGLGAGARPAAALDGEGWQPLAAVPNEPAALTAGEAAAAVDQPGKPPAKKRSNSAPPVPSTGVKPQPRGNAGTVPRGGDMASDAQVKAIHSLFSFCGIKDDAQRHRVAGHIVGHDVASFNDLTKTEGSAVIDALNDVKAGRIAIEGDELAAVGGDAA
jgi:hypothetical protein